MPVRRQTVQYVRSAGAEVRRIQQVRLETLSTPSPLTPAGMADIRRGDRSSGEGSGIATARGHKTLGLFIVKLIQFSELVLSSVSCQQQAQSSAVCIKSSPTIRTSRSARL